MSRASVDATLTTPDLLVVHFSAVFRDCEDIEDEYLREFAERARTRERRETWIVLQRLKPTEASAARRR